MLNDFQAFKDIIADRETKVGPITTNDKANLIMRSLKGQHLICWDEAKQIAIQIEKED